MAVRVGPPKRARMASERSIIYFGPGRAVPSASVSGFARDRRLALHQAPSVEEVVSLLNRSFPACLVLDASRDAETAFELCRTMKADAFTAIVPIVVQVAGEGKESSA